MTDPRHVGEALSREEWARFFETANEYCAARDRVFVLDESRRMFGERAWANYVRGLMLEFGLKEMAARLDPEQFPAEQEERAFTPLSRSRSLLDETTITIGEDDARR
ncbi:MAG: hypothetical protein ACK5LO_10150 [Leucobacter sp.]